MTQEHCNQCPHTTYCPDKGTDNECSPEANRLSALEEKLQAKINRQQEQFDFTTKTYRQYERALRSQVFQFKREADHLKCAFHEYRTEIKQLKAEKENQCNICDLVSKNVNYGIELNKLTDENIFYTKKICTLQEQVDGLEIENRRLKTSIYMNNDHYIEVDRKNKILIEALKGIETYPILRQATLKRRINEICSIKYLAEQALAEKSLK